MILAPEVLADHDTFTDPADAVADWNKHNPIGTLVTVRGTHKTWFTMEPAAIDFGRLIAVVKVCGLGRVALSRVAAVEAGARGGGDADGADE